MSCACTQTTHDHAQIVLTGGPGAGKTAVLELVRKHFCEHLMVLPEAASIVFGGGFPRLGDTPARQAAQRAIARVQHELEAIARSRSNIALSICDRGTIDGLAYWPGPADAFFAGLGTTLAAELARYRAVIHLHPPPADNGYTRANNRLRIETAAEAASIDARIIQAWSSHPRRYFVASTDDFMVKAQAALALIAQEMPACCRHPPD
jgi:predicted ATPase